MKEPAPKPDNLTMYRVKCFGTKVDTEEPELVHMLWLYAKDHDDAMKMADGVVEGIWDFAVVVSLSDYL